MNNFKETRVGSNLFILTCGEINRTTYANSQLSKDIDSGPKLRHFTQKENQGDGIDKQD